MGIAAPPQGLTGGHHGAVGRTLGQQFIFFPVRGMLSISLTALFALGAIVHFMAAWTGGHLF